MAEKDTKKRPGTLFDNKVWVAFGILGLLLVLLFLFKTLFSTLLLVLAGVLLAIYFVGFAHLIEKMGIPYKVSIVLSVVVSLALIVGFFWFAGARLESQISELSDKLPQTVQHVEKKLNSSAVGRKLLAAIQFSGDAEKTRTMVKTFFSSSFGVLSDIYIVLLLALFFIASPTLYRKGVIHLLPVRAKKQGDQIISDLAKRLKNWIIGEIVGFFFIAIFTALALWILGMPLILTLALIAAILNFIPNFGPLIALVPAVLLALLESSHLALLVVILYTVVQVLQSAVTRPLITQKMVQVPPALVIFTQVAMGLLAGFWGVLLAIPIDVIVMELVNKLYVERQSWHKYDFQDGDE